MRGAHERRTGRMSPALPGRRAALVIAHPGHELRVHGWVELARPLAFVLTDGSGHTGQSRLTSTSGLLERAGAAPGGIYGRLTDRALYAAILGGDVDLVAGLAGEVAATFAETGLEAFRIECLRPVGDSAPPEDPPYYERYGERQVMAGHYGRVLRYREHFAPLEAALRRRIEATA